jgi:serine/threonine protein kinase
LRDWHDAGLWHKDIKPENVIVHDGRATLVDLGLVTPLASHMTLTTHGTEYFRDPELVRQALRGARVSEVDAARFDLYGAGAVLTSCSREPSRRTACSARSASRARRRSNGSPAARWRTSTGAIPTRRRCSPTSTGRSSGKTRPAVRPADLPSMRGSDAESGAMEERSEEARFLDQTMRGGDTRAETPPTRPLSPPPDATLLIRPTVKVTNWWTGDYTILSLRPPSPLFDERADPRRRRRDLRVRDRLDRLRDGARLLDRVRVTRRALLISRAESSTGRRACTASNSYSSLRLCMRPSEAFEPASRDFSAARPSSTAFMARRMSDNG